MNLETEHVQIPLSHGGKMGGYLARPTDSETRPGVLVFMEIFGVNAHIRDVTERIAREGFVALAPDYFHRTAPGVELEYTDEGMQKGMGYLGQLVADEMISDAQAALDYLQSQPNVGGQGVGAIGFCIGGHMTYLTACTAGIRAAAAYYGGGIAAPEGPGGAPSTVSRTSKIEGKIHCYFGGQDSMIPADQVETIRQALRGAGTRHEVVVYDDADHGFNCDQRASFDGPSAEDAWRRSMDLFNAELR